MGWFSRKKENNEKEKPRESKMQHCLKYDIYFILSGNECEDCQVVDECNSYKNHRDFEDGELFFAFVDKKRPMPFAFFSHVNGDEGISMEPFNFDEPLPTEAEVSLIEPEFERYLEIMSYLRSNIPDDTLPEEVIFNTKNGEIAFPLESILKKLTDAQDNGPDNNGRYSIILDANEAVKTFELIRAISRNLPLVGCLPEESWLRKVHALIPLLAGKLMAI